MSLFPRSKSRSFLVGCLRAAALLPGMLAGVASAETLQDAIAAAYERNPVLNNRRYQLKSLNEEYVQARSQYGPTLSLSGQGVYNNLRRRGNTTDSNNGELSLRLSQPLYTGGQVRGAVASARATVLSGQQNLRQVEADTIRDVIAVYAAVIRDEQRQAVGRENVAVLQEQLRENRARRSVEDVTLTDVAQADARLAAAETQLATLDASLAVSRGEFLQVVGHNPGTLEPLPDLPGLPGTSDQAYAAAEMNNPSLLAAKYVEQSSSATVASVRGQLRPSVALSAEAGYTGQLSPFERRNFDRTIAAGVTVTQPLFAAGAIASRIRQAEVLNTADQIAIDIARRQALQNVTQAWSQLAAARVSLTSGQRQVESAQIAFAGMQREQRFGLRSTIETLNAEQELQGAQLTLLQNRYGEYVSRAALLAAIGRLEARYLAPAVAIQDPEEDFRKVRNAGRTPFELVAQMLDRVGSSGLRTPLPAELTGEDGPIPDTVPELPPTPDEAAMRGPLVPITQSPLVPASALPGDHMPRTGYIPPSPPPPPPPFREKP
jgi:outer membrane protein